MSVPAAWVVGLMMALEPSAPWRTTYEKTAEAIARAAEAEPLFEEKGEERTAALLVSVAWYESHFKPNAKSSNGKWFCLYQIDKRYLSDPEKSLSDPEFCTRTAVKIIKNSFQQCDKHPENERLSVYLSGSCDKAVKQSKYRMFLMGKLLREHPMPDGGGGGASALRAR